MELRTRYVFYHGMCSMEEGPVCAKTGTSLGSGTAYGKPIRRSEYCNANWLHSKSTCDSAHKNRKQSITSLVCME